MHNDSMNAYKKPKKNTCTAGGWLKRPRNTNKTTTYYKTKSKHQQGSKTRTQRHETNGKQPGILKKQTWTEGGWLSQSMKMRKTGPVTEQRTGEEQNSKEHEEISKKRTRSGRES